MASVMLLEIEAVAQHAMAFAEADTSSARNGTYPPSLSKPVPVEPAQLIVLAVGVVVALLAVCDFITHEDHGHALADQENGHGVLHQPAAQLVDLQIICRPFNAAVPTDNCGCARPGFPRRWPCYASRCRRRGRPG